MPTVLRYIFLVLTFQDGPEDLPELTPLQTIIPLLVGLAGMVLVWYIYFTFDFTLFNRL